MKIAGIVLIVLQLVAFIGGGGVPSMGSAYDAGYLLGFFLPGIIGVVLLLKGISKENANKDE